MTVKPKLFIVFLFTAAMSFAAVPAGAAAEPNAVSAKTEMLARKWLSLEYGMYIHFPFSRFYENRTPGDSKAIPDVQQWVRMAKISGMKFAVLVVKHEDGFCLWDSRDYDNDIAKFHPQKDVLAEFIAACRKEGIKPGIHYSVSDNYNEVKGKLSKGPLPPSYFNLIKQQTEELHKTYPGIFFHKFDWGGRFSPEQRRQLHELIALLNPDCLVFSAGIKSQNGLLVGNETAPGLDKDAFVPGIGDQTIVDGWFWSPQAKIEEAPALFEMYKQCRKMRINFLLNVGPDMTGRIPKEQIVVLDELKKLIAGQPQKPDVPQAVAAGGDAKERLKNLKELYDSGLISKEAYEAKQKEILDSL